MNVEKLIIELQKLIEVNPKVAEYDVGYHEFSNDGTFLTPYGLWYDTVDEIEVHSDDELIRFV